MGADICRRKISATPPPFRLCPLHPGDGAEVRVQDGTIWLSQKNIGLLFETTLENVLVHLKKIYTENELPEAATAKEYLAVQTEGKRQVQRSILHYSLDAIIAVGYRVNSKRATAFRQWATGVLRDYTLRGQFFSSTQIPVCLWFIWKNGNASTKRSAFRTAEIYNHPAMAKAHANFQLT